MVWPWILAGALLLVVLGTIIFLLYYAQVVTVQNNSADFIVPLQGPVSMLYRCGVDYDCQDFYQCDSIEGVCKLSQGQPCDTAAQCLNGGICSGICTLGPPGIISGQPNDPCPCPDNMTCAPNALGALALVCKLNADEPCQTDSQCLSTDCQNNFCTPGLPDGQPCTVDQNCQSQNCSLGWCQPADVTTGEIGAVCTVQGQPPCNPGVACISGVCGQPESGLGLSCDASTACSEPMQCGNISNNAPCQPGQGCYCQYEFDQNGLIYRPDPNGCSVVGVCGPDYTCTAGICLAEADQPCLTGTNCLSGVCGTTGGVYSAVFTYFDPDSQETVSTTLPSSVFGSFTIEWQLLTAGIPAPLGVQRLLVNYPAGVETVYYMVPGNPLAPTTTGIIGLDGVTRINGYVSNPSGNFTLLDAVLFGDGQGLLLYSQVTDTASNTVIYNLDGSPYNPTTGTGLPGTQYSGDVALTIAGIDISTAGDVLALDNTQTLYVKRPTDTQFSKAKDTTTGATITGVTVPRFYPDVGGFPPYQNIGFIMPYNVDGTNYGNILQFTGNIEGALYPVFDPERTGGVGLHDQYNVVDQGAYADPTSGIVGGSFIIVATNQATGQTNIFLTPASGNQPIPGYVNNLARVVSSQTGFYLYVTGSCA